MTLILSSIVTEKTISEFLFLKFTIEQYYDRTKWYLSCDSKAYETLGSDLNIKVFEMVQSDDADHNLLDEGKRDRWMEVMLTKFDICEKALEENDYVLFLDSDMFFVNPIEDRVLNLIKNAKNLGIDAFVCQHMTNDINVEANHGYFNAGQFVVTSKNFLAVWKKLSLNYKKYGFYFEQGSLEYAQRNFVTVNFPINYDIGWWRFNNQNTISRLSFFNLDDDGKLMFGNSPAINFHVHTLRKLETQNYGQFLVDNIFQYLRQSKNIKYQELVSFYDFFKGNRDEQ